MTTHRLVLTSLLAAGCHADVAQQAIDLGDEPQADYRAIAMTSGQGEHLSIVRTTDEQCALIMLTRPYLWNEIDVTAPDGWFAWHVAAGPMTERGCPDGSWPPEATFTFAAVGDIDWPDDEPGYPGFVDVDVEAVFFGVEDGMTDGGHIEPGTAISFQAAQIAVENPYE